MTSPKPCPTCADSGMIQVGVYDGAGLKDVDVEPCPDCQDLAPPKCRWTVIGCGEDPCVCGSTKESR